MLNIDPAHASVLQELLRDPISTSKWDNATNFIWTSNQGTFETEQDGTSFLEALDFILQNSVDHRPGSRFVGKHLGDIPKTAQDRLYPIIERLGLASSDDNALG
jgi:hypothetical protein